MSKDFATLECEWLARRRFRSQGEARMAIFSDIESFYKAFKRALHRLGSPSASDAWAGEQWIWSL